jgi:spore coat protein U-like protein
MKRWSHRGALATALLGTLIGGVATADQVANMTVSANVVAACQLTSIPTIAFGALTLSANNDAQGNISWVCTNGFSSEIRLDGGNTGDINGRRMSDGASGTLAYQLYTDASRTTVFGDGTTQNDVPVTGIGYATPQNVTVYGRVLQADAALATAGAYTDTVDVTIVF